MQYRLIRGKPSSLIQARLNAFCREAGHSGNHHYLFRPDGHATPITLIQACRLLANSRFVMRTVRDLRRGLPSILRFGIPNATIRVKNNIRLHYTQDGSNNEEQGLRSVKIGVPATGYRNGSMAREIRARRILQSVVPTICVPRILRYDEMRLTWLEEEYISPDKCISRESSARRFLHDYAIGLYTPFARGGRLAKSLNSLGVTFEEVQSVFEEVGVRFGDHYLDSVWPISLIHGDLSPGNMISHSGHLYLVDWELFGVGPVAWDLRKLCLSEPESVYEVLEEFSTPTSQGGIPPRCQIKVVHAVQVVRLRKNREKTLVYQTKHLGKTHCLAIQDLRYRERGLIEALRGEV